MGLIRSLEGINYAIKVCSNDYFDFDTVNDSLFKVPSTSGTIEEVIRKHLEIIFWIHWKSKSYQNSWLQIAALPRPTELSFQKLQNSNQIGPISQDLVFCGEKSKHELTKLNYKTLESKFKHILNDYGT